MIYYDAVVLRTAAVTPQMLRVTFGGAGLRSYVAEGFPDDYCKVLFPHPGDPAPVLPVEVDGLEVTPAGKVAAPVRNYTIRRFDPAVPEVDIDFLLHAGGVAATWARSAAAGARVALTAAYGNHEPPPDTTWQLLVGDATALPAIGRILDGIAPGQPVTVVAVVHDAAEEQTFGSPGALTARWVHEPATDRVADALITAVRDTPLPDGPGYVWVAGEAAATRAARKYLRHELGWPGERYHTLGYWRVDGERWEQRYHALAPELETRIDAVADLIESDVDGYLDAVEQIYEEAGL